MRRTGLLLVSALLTLLIAPSHARNCTVLSQTSGERMTGSVCRILETEHLSGAHTEHESTESPHGEGVVMELAWLQAGERRDLPMLLAYLSTLNIRATMELPSTRFNDGPMSLLMAHGGAVFEREMTEPIGATRPLAEAFATAGGAFLLLDDFTPHRSSEVTKSFEVAAGTPKILVTVLITDPSGLVRLVPPSGSAVPPTRRTGKALQWEIRTPAMGTWKISASQTLRTRFYVQIPEAPDPMEAASCGAPGAIENGTPSEGEWSLDRATEDGLRSVSHGGPGEGPRTPGEGSYALTWRTGGRIYRRGIHAGPTRPILFRPTPSGVVRGVPDTGIRCAVLGMDLRPNDFVARVSGTTTSFEVIACGSARGISAAELRIPAPIGAPEGPTRVEVAGAGSSDSWIYVLDAPTAENLRISEVHPTAGWVEIEALREVEDLSAYGLTDLESGPVTLPRGQLAAGERRVFQIRNVERPTGMPLSREIFAGGRDQMALVRGDGEDFAVIDAVVWDDGSETAWSEAENSDTEFLVSRGEWSGPPVQLPDPTSSIGRVSAGDVNSAQDFHILYYPSPSAPNTYDPALEAVSAGDVAVSEVGIWDPKGAWIEIEVRRGPVDIAAFSIGDADGVPSRLGTEPRILQAGGRFLVRFRRGAGDENLLVQAEPPGLTSDQAVISLGGRVIDAVGWRTPSNPVPRAEADDFRRLRLTPIDLPEGVPGAPLPSLARIEGSWQWSYFPTPGAENRIMTAPPRGCVRIAAVSPSMFGRDWAEIICVSGTVDVSRFVLTDLDGDDVPLAESPVTLREGERVTVYWGGGEDEVDGVGPQGTPWVDANGNGARDIYLGGRGDALAATDDQLVLVWGDEIHDAVVWTNNDGTMSRDAQKDLQYLLAKGEWTGSVAQSSAVIVGNYRLPIERIDPMRDTNGKDDWRSRVPAAQQ